GGSSTLDGSTYIGPGGFYVDSNGQGQNGSDRELKQNIHNIPYGLDTINSMRPVAFNFKSNDAPSIGFIAQELETVIPEIVSGTEGRKSVNYASITSVLVKAVQELSAEVETLKSEIETLSGNSIDYPTYNEEPNSS